MSSTKTAKKKVQDVVQQGGIYFLKKNQVTKTYGKLSIKSRPPTIKPGQFGEDDVLVGNLFSVLRIEPRKGSDGKPWVKLHIKPDGDDIGVEIAAGALIRQALEIDLTDEGATSPYLGRTISLELGNPPRLKSKQGSDAWNFIVRMGDEV